MFFFSVEFINSTESSIISDVFAFRNQFAYLRILLQNNRAEDEARQEMLAKDPPEISWENTLGSPHGVPFDDDTKELLRKCLDVSVPPPTSVAELIKRSNAFPVKFPISTVRCAALKDRGIAAETIEVCIKKSYFIEQLQDT